jgi:hypothetical protein
MALRVIPLFAAIRSLSFEADIGPDFMSTWAMRRASSGVAVSASSPHRHKPAGGLCRAVAVGRWTEMRKPTARGLNVDQDAAGTKAFGRSQPRGGTSPKVYRGEATSGSKRGRRALWRRSPSPSAASASKTRPQLWSRPRSEARRCSCGGPHSARNTSCATPIEHVDDVPRLSPLLTNWDIGRPAA